MVNINSILTLWRKISIFLSIKHLSSDYSKGKIKIITTRTKI